MVKFLTNVRLIAGALAIMVVIAVAAPICAQQPNSVDPTTSAVHEQQLLQQLNSIRGRGTIPDTGSYVIEHPAGRGWQEFRMVTLEWIGGIAIIGMLVLLILFYLWRGSIKIEGGRSGRTILRFNSFERFIHWLTAACFIVLAITGLNVTFGRRLFVSSGGSEAFSTWSQWAKYVHNYLSFAFTLGVVVMFLMWIRNNFPTAVDIEWLKMGGGMGKSHRRAPAWKFNAGEKLLYWLVVLASADLIISGYMLIFPFYGGLTIARMELAEVFHGVVAMLFIALILAHIYIGTLGTEGAFEAMGDGTVDVNWAKEHHRLWFEQENRTDQSAASRRAAATAAE